MTTVDNNNKSSKRLFGIIGCGGCLIVSAIVLLAVAGLLTTLLVFIEPDERGVVLSPYEPTGYRREVLGPGLHLLKPGEQAQVYLISRQSYTMTSSSTTQPGSIIGRSQDGQEMEVDASLVYALDPEGIIDIHVRWQNHYQDGLVRPLARGTIRQTVSEYDANEATGIKRAEVQQVIFERLKSELAQEHIVLVEFVMQDIRRSR